MISGVLLKSWTLVKPSPIDFPALFTGYVFICVLIGLSLTTSLLRSAGHAVSCCNVTWRKILRLKWRQVVAIRALFLFSFISFEMTEKYLWPLTDCKCLLCYFHLYFVFLSNVVSNLLFSFEKKVCQLSIINYELSAMTVVKFLKKKWYSLMWKPPVVVRVTLLYTNFKLSKPASHLRIWKHKRFDWPQVVGHLIFQGHAPLDTF